MIFEQKNVGEELDLIPLDVQILHPKQNRKYVLLFYLLGFSTFLIIVTASEL